MFMEDNAEAGQRLLESAFNHERANPLDTVPDDVLISWAQSKPSEYFPRLAAIITPFRQANSLAALEWTPLAMQILALAPDRPAVLAAFSRNLYPHSWSGSLAELLEGRRVLLQALMSYSDPAVEAWARVRDEALVREIESERLRDRRADARFE